MRTKLLDWAVWQARASCYSHVALSSNDSKTRYSYPIIPLFLCHLRDSVRPLHARDAGGGEDEGGVRSAALLLLVQLPQPRVQVAPDVGDRQVGVSCPKSNTISRSTVVILVTTSNRFSSEGN